MPAPSPTQDKPANYYNYTLNYLQTREEQETNQQREQREILCVHLNNEGIPADAEIEHFTENGFIAATWRVNSRTGKTFSYNSRCYEFGSSPQEKPKGDDWVSYEIHHNGKIVYVFEDMFRRLSQR